MNITDINSLETQKMTAIFQSLPTEHRKTVLNLAKKLLKEHRQKKWLESLGGAKNDSGAG
jgi:hypothetical protein